MFKRLNRPAVWSNFFYLVPLVEALFFELWFTAVSITTLLIFSLAFHYSREKKFVAADFLAAGVVAMFCLTLVLSGGLWSGYTLIAVLLVVIGLYIRFWVEQGNRGGLVHAAWHMVAAALILASILSYVA